MTFRHISLPRPCLMKPFGRGALRKMLNSWPSGSCASKQWVVAIERRAICSNVLEAPNQQRYPGQRNPRWCGSWLRQPGADDRKPKNIC